MVFLLFKMTQTKKRRRKRKGDSYGIYIYRVLKYLHPDLKISSQSMMILNCFVQDLLHKLSLEAGRLSRYNRKSTLMARDFRSSVRLLLAGELAKHAMNEADKSLARYRQSNN